MIKKKIVELTGSRAQAMIRLINELATHVDRLRSSWTRGHRANARHEPSYFAHRCGVQEGWSWLERMH